jgi:hypothetical protein
MFKPILGAIVFASVVFVLGLSNVGEAGPPWYTTTGKLTRVGTGLTGEGFYLELDVLTHDNSCKFPQSLLLPAGSPQYQDIVSSAQLAFAQARPLDVFYDGSCWGDNVKLFAIAIRSSP